MAQREIKRKRVQLKKYGCGLKILSRVGYPDYLKKFPKKLL